MKEERIKALSKFFYSSNSAKEVPLRISITMGMSGGELNHFEFEELMRILSNSINLKADLEHFVEKIY